MNYILEPGTLVDYTAFQGAAPVRCMVKRHLGMSLYELVRISDSGIFQAMERKLEVVPQEPKSLWDEYL